MYIEKEGTCKAIEEAKNTAREYSVGVNMVRQGTLGKE